MDDFKHLRKRRVVTLDGFVSNGRRPVPSGRQPGAHQAHPPHGNSHSHRADPTRTPRRSSVYRNSSIDGFQVADGFRPIRQPHIEQPNFGRKPHEMELGLPHTLEQPAQSVSGKRRLFGRKHKAAKKPKSKYYKLKLGLKISSFAMLAMLLVGGGLVLKGYLKARNIFKGGSEGAVALNADVDPTQLNGEGDGRVNVLLLGKGGEGHTAPDLTDSLVVASIDPLAKEAVLLSVPRDLWVKSPSGAESKLNAVYANAKSGVLNGYSSRQRGTAAVIEEAEKAGIEALESTVADHMGVPIHYYFMIDFEGFRKAIDTVGGIDIDVKERLYDPTVAWENKGNPLIADTGMQHFDGKKALLYARSRYGSSRGDFDRAARQREIMMATKTKIVSLGTFANPMKLNQLIDNFGDHISTDFSINEIMRVYEIGKDIEASKVASVGLADPPHSLVQTDAVNGASIVRPKAGLYDYSAIQSFVRNAMKDAFLKKEDATITVLNGTEVTGLATKKSNELKSFGYNVVSVGDSPLKGVTKTIVVDLKNGQMKYTKNYLEQRFGTTAVTSLPSGVQNTSNADFVIILGSDAANNVQN